MSAAAASTDNLAPLRAKYFERLEQRVNALTLFLDVCAKEAAVADDIDDAHRCAHSMISSAAMFGYARLSEAARAAETAFEKRTDAQMYGFVSPVEHLVRIAREVLDANRDMPV